MDGLLLAALARTLCTWPGSDSVAIDLEGHGREALSGELDPSGTVGWFTSLYPVNFEIPRDASEGVLIEAVKAHLSQVPHKGIGYGLLRYLQDAESPSRLPAHSGAQVLF
ncbi:MAG: condensation domain-containing protein, partial [Methylococcales bacterium]